MKEDSNLIVISMPVTCMNYWLYSSVVSGVVSWLTLQWYPMGRACDIPVDMSWFVGALAALTGPVSWPFSLYLLYRKYMEDHNLRKLRN